MTDHGLELLLDYHGRRHRFASGHYLKFVIRRTTPNERMPHGLDYSLTMHAPDGTRLLGYDNAHVVPHPGSKYTKGPTAADHWHRTESDPGRPYYFVDAAALLTDFFDEVERIVAELEIPYDIVGEETDDDDTDT